MKKWLTSIGDLMARRLLERDEKRNDLHSKEMCQKHYGKSGGKE